jgi:hypothetical protein
MCTIIVFYFVQLLLALALLLTHGIRSAPPSPGSRLQRAAILTKNKNSCQ